ncbi:type IV pilus modification protein PilV [Teredinibacter purpureus]|jgi:type IV pilus modification protein PilV|uniref:type IV pilus modification protein PilV n=1 Tax=Teredinibacter purpureus TaxID=2731756 RepID=UPI0005F84BF1|nr:type IV pilus modification protein PilV [Teredinibacter purpureus]
MSLIGVRRYSLQKQCGFSMVEILISFIVLAAGLLGIASIQKKGVDNNHAAYLRTQAVSLAQDMTSRVRSNTAGFEAGNYNRPNSSYNANCLGAGCTAAQMASHDSFEWSSELALVLPIGEGIVCVDSSPDDGDNLASPACDGAGSELVIKIWWDAIPKDGEVDQRYAITFSI